MKSANQTELQRLLKADQLNPLYLLTGCENYLRDQAAAAITNVALRETLLREFNEETFSLMSGSPQGAIAAAEQLPMMSNRRVVEIKDFGKLREAEEQVLIRYVENPAPSTVMIFNAADLDKRRTLTKILLDMSLVVDFPALKDGEAMKWIKSRLEELRIGADEKALADIVALVGTDVQTLMSELDKLASAAGESKRITLVMVEELIGRSRELSNFDLGDHLVGRNRKRALETLHRLLAGGSEPVMLIGLIARDFHRLALAKDALDRGSREDVFKTVPMPFFKRDAFLATLQRSDADRIALGIKLIAAADLAIKTSVAGSAPKGPRLQLEMLICELAV